MSGCERRQTRKINALPRAQQKLSLFDNNCGTAAHGSRLCVSGGVALGVTKCLAVRECLFIGKQQIPLHVWVSVFIDGNTCGRMRTIDHTNAALDTAFCHCPFDLSRYRNEARNRRGEMVRVKHGKPSLSLCLSIL